MRRRGWLLVAVLALAVAGCGELPAVGPAQVGVTAVGETEPVPSAGDAADDPAIWIHPDDPSLSTVIGTDKDGGVAVYDLGGRQLHYDERVAPNNVDLRYGFPLDGRQVALVAVSEKEAEEILLYAVDPATRGLRQVGAVPSGIDLYGVCLHRSAGTGRFSVFGTAYDGVVAQWQLSSDRGGAVAARQVRAFDVGDRVEGCVADDELGQLYIGEEQAGLWRYGAEPDAGDERTVVDSVEDDGGRLAGDVEGVAIAYGPGGEGHLVVSSQGSDDYLIYERAGDNDYVARFAIDAGGVDGVSHTDGLEVTTAGLGPAFPAGLLVVQDDVNDAGNQNFKLVRWDAVLRAADRA